MNNCRDTRLLFELSKPGSRGARLPACDVPENEAERYLPSSALATAPPALPELSEPQVIRHFVNLSKLNMSVDTHFYPLGSCTMKYNPKRNERAASLPGLADLHPYQPAETLQGMLQLLYQLQEALQEIAGLAACSLQPAAGAHGELAALMVGSAYFRDLGQHRTEVLVPDNAHGTNPASAAMGGFKAVVLKTTSTGLVDMEDLASKLSERTAVLMITNPSTLGLFEPNIRQIADQVHAIGGLVYLDGANMNAILGVTRPGDFGADMQHYNPHKTFSGPHGGGGPGAGPICVTDRLAPYLPSPVVVKEMEEGTGRTIYRLDFDRPKSIGRVRSFFGNVGVLIRAYATIRTHGPDGLRRIAENAVLNANYLLHQVQPMLPVPQGDRCMHEFVASAAGLKASKQISAMDIAKQLLDYGFHAPTVYFPLTVPESIMIEPTETESKETLDAFAEALAHILQKDPEQLHQAPHTTPISRPDEVQAARQPKLAYKERRAES
jgi:glycine cleavage system P protein (glycine dehydrogenase) subunit 2